MMKNQRITVYIDDEPRRFFFGLRVRHAIGYQVAWRVERCEVIIQDENGNQVDLDSALYEGQRLYVKPIP